MRLRVANLAFRLRDVNFQPGDVVGFAIGGGKKPTGKRPISAPGLNVEHRIPSWAWDETACKGSPCGVGCFRDVKERTAAGERQGTRLAAHTGWNCVYRWTAYGRIVAHWRRIRTVSAGRLAVGVIIAIDEHASMSTGRFFWELAEVVGGKGVGAADGKVISVESSSWKSRPLCLM
jgi:hypothetical protein